MENICIDELRRKIRKSVLDLSVYFKLSLHSLKRDIMRGETGMLITADMMVQPVNRKDLGFEDNMTQYTHHCALCNCTK